MSENWREIKIKNKGTNKRAAAWFRYTRYICPLSTCIPSFNLLGLIVPEKSMTKNFNVWKLERKKNYEIKGWISSSSWFRYTRYICPLSTCTKFKSSRPHSSWEKCDENVFNAWKLERKMKNKGMHKQQQPDSGTHGTSAHCPCLYQVWTF